MRIFLLVAIATVLVVAEEGKGERAGIMLGHVAAGAGVGAAVKGAMIAGGAAAAKLGLGAAAAGTTAAATSTALVTTGAATTGAAAAGATGAAAVGAALLPAAAIGAVAIGVPLGIARVIDHKGKQKNRREATEFLDAKIAEWTAGNQSESGPGADAPPATEEINDMIN